MICTSTTYHVSYVLLLCVFELNIVMKHWLHVTSFRTHAASAVGVQMVSTSTGHRVSLAGVGADRVEAHVTRRTRSRHAQTLVYICRTKETLRALMLQTLLWCLIVSVSPMQLPRASWMNPTPHCTLGRQRNEPAVFWHSSSAAQLWVPVSHSSMSETANRTLQLSYMSITIHINNYMWRIV